MTAVNSALIWSGVQKMCASFKVMERTRLRPLKHARTLVTVHGAQLGDAHRQIAIAAHLRLRRSGCGAGSSWAAVPSARFRDPWEETCPRDSAPNGRTAGRARPWPDRVYRRADTRSRVRAPRMYSSSTRRTVAPFGKPKREAGADQLVDREQLQFFADAAMVALLGFLQPVEVIVEFFLSEESGAVDALKLRVLFVCLSNRRPRWTAA